MKASQLTGTGIWTGNSKARHVTRNLGDNFCRISKLPQLLGNQRYFLKYQEILPDNEHVRINQHTRVK